MIDFSKLSKYAPSLPPLQAQFQAIQLETIAGSNERFTVLVVAKTNTEYRIIQTISAEILNCMFKENGDNMQGFIEITQDSLELHLANNQPLEAWQPPISGVFKSDICNTRSHDINGVLFQAITSSASLYQGDLIQKPIDEILGVEQISNDTINQRLKTNVRQLILKSKPEFKDRFDKKITLIKGSFVNIDYAGIKFNASISDFNVNHKKTAIDRAKSKLFDLDVLRSNQANSTTPEQQQFELLVGFDKEDNQQSDLLNQLTEQADMLDLMVRGLKDSQQIATHIIKLESA